LNSYHSLGHPSEPNYLASVYGDRFGLGSDVYSYVPQNITNVFDLLDTKAISWACYQENMPYDGAQDYQYTQPSYIPGAAGTNYTYYVSNKCSSFYRGVYSDNLYVSTQVRKHNPCAFPIESQASISPARANRNRNFNDFAADLNASALPQWAFVTPNVSDHHLETKLYIVFLLLTCPLLWV
jgi:hypothetical protein